MTQSLMGVVRLTASPTTIVAHILPLDDRELFNPCWTKFVLGTGAQPALEIVRVTRPSIPAQNYTRIFLYPVAGGTSGHYIQNKFPDPGNWNPVNNKIEVVGWGQSGWGAGVMPLEGEPGPLIPPTSGLGGGGGGGGAYGWAANQPAVFPVGYTVWWGGTVTTPGTVCVWGSDQYSSPAASPLTGMVYAGGGTGGQNTSPGSGGDRFFPAGFLGGGGGAGSNGGGGGGGGAAGPAGAGANATAATSTTFGAGGSGNGGTNAGGTTAGAPGVSGIEWGIAGIGGGGAGNITGSTGGVGGLYGGGGGGSDQNASPAGRLGGDGLIVITYVPIYSIQAQVIA